MAHNMEKPIKFPQWTGTLFDISYIFGLFDMESMQNPEKQIWEVYFFLADFWHLLESSKNHSPMVRGGTFFQKCKLFYSCNFGTS